MEIESNNAAQIATPQSQLEAFMNSLTDRLRTAIELKSINDFEQITLLLKKQYPQLTAQALLDLFTEKKSLMTEALIRTAADGRSSIPCPHNEQDVADVLLFALAMYHDRRYAAAKLAFNSLLFEPPHDFASRVYLVSFSSFLLAKYLNAIEQTGDFENTKVKVYDWLTLFQGASFEPLFATTYVFLLRNLLKKGHLRETAQLLKNCRFPEHIGHSLLAKYLLYKATYLAHIGHITQAANFVTESLRKAPDGRTKRGLNGFKLRARKLKLILQLIMNEPPTHQWLNYARIPPHYMNLVHAVNLGNHDEFEKVIKNHRTEFSRDGSLALLEKMRSVVMRNALKKLSLAYSKISIRDVLKKIGADADKNFDLDAFLTKVHRDLPEFLVDHKQGFIQFKRTSDNYASLQTREALVKRVQHLQGLEEQVTKNLRYRQQVKEVAKEEDAEDSGEDDYHFSDYSENDMDI